MTALKPGFVKGLLSQVEIAAHVSSFLNVVFSVLFGDQGMATLFLR